jgi:hypothetical protein
MNTAKGLVVVQLVEPSSSPPLLTACCWMRRYHPGMDEVVLQRNASTGRVGMEVIEVTGLLPGLNNLC